jgi:4-hydroxy-tetrahydrodipicolinate reductase
MGNRLIHLIQADPETVLAGAIEAPNSPKLGIDAGTLVGLEPLDVKVSTFDDLSESVDAVIDFSHPMGADAAIEFCKSTKTPLVMATTGLEEDTIDRIRDVSEELPIVWAPNMSLAVNLTMKLVEVAAQALKNESVDVEIIERHHRFKADSPSGTALKFGELVAQQMKQSEHRHGRHGIVGQRPQNEIGYHAVRAGDNPGEHTIIFGMMGETIELKVAASNRDCYALGAISAAKFVMQQRPGLYSMMDVLGLK